MQSLYTHLNIYALKKHVFLILTLCIVMSSCQKDEEPFISIHQTDVTFTDAGGSQVISFESNTKWTVRSSEAWCTVSPASGGASNKSITITLSSNESYEARSCTVTIVADGLSKTLNVNQSAQLGLLITQNKYELSNDATTIEVEVKANIEYDVIISDNWITSVATRGLSTTKSSFEIAKNESYDNREGTITFKQKGGALSSSIKVYQSQVDAIILSEKIKYLSNNSQELKVELKTNVDFEMIIPEDAKKWVSYIGTRSLRTEILSLNIDSNEVDKPRSTEVYIKHKAIKLQDTLKIYQQGNEEGVYWVEKMGALSAILNQTQKDTITTMIVKGEINKADFEVMKSQMPRLRHVDLLDVKCEDNKLPDFAFGDVYGYSKEDLSTIVLPKSITSIGSFAFNNCYWLSGTLVLPEGLTSIGEFAFSACNNLRGDLMLPKGLTSIGEAAFNQCYGLTGSLTLPESLASIGKDAFNSCVGLKGSLTITKSLTTIPIRAFAGCSGLSGSLTLPDGLTSIENFAFFGCSSLTGPLTLPDELISIGEGAFLECSGLNGSLILPNELSSIGESAFRDCSGFTETLTLAGKLTRIEPFTFYGCTGFTGSLILPDGVTISKYAFQDCVNIRGDIFFPNSLNSIGQSSFWGCDKVVAFQFPHTTPLTYKYSLDFDNYMFPISATIKVPLSAVDSYKNTEKWREHNIVGY